MNRRIPYAVANYEEIVRDQYYLGMLTYRDRFALEFPNLTVTKIFTEYFNELERIDVSLGYTDMFRQFLQDHDWRALFGGYWRQYIGQIPAQAFDKANENFFRTTFFELFVCTVGAADYRFFDLGTSKIGIAPAQRS